MDNKRIVKFKLKFSQRYIAFVNYVTLVFPIDGYMKQFYCSKAGHCWTNPYWTDPDAGMPIRTAIVDLL